MAQDTQAKNQKKLDDEEEQETAKDEPMGSVAAAVPRDAGSAVNQVEECNRNTAPPHEGGPATLVAGKETHKAEKANEAEATPGKDPKEVHNDLKK